MSIKPFLIVSNNISFAWGQVFLELMQRGVQELSPVIISINNIDDSQQQENMEIRDLLDQTLVKVGTHPPCQTTANTIFPKSLWRIKQPRNLLFKRYNNILKLIHKDHRNHNGTYFERLINYENAHKNPNQLEYIIQTRENGNLRRSSYQALIYDPRNDQTDQRQRGFPCLQSVSFIPTDNDGLIVNGFYPVQHIFTRAYGNYLGLYNLGKFMAHEMKLQLRIVNCFSGVVLLGSKKEPLTILAQKTFDILSKNNH